MGLGVVFILVVSLSRRLFFTLVPALAGVILFYGRIKKSIQKKYAPMELASCDSRIYQDLSKGTPVHLTTSGIPAAFLTGYSR
jgi:hypothetical protein